MGGRVRFAHPGGNDDAEPVVEYQQPRPPKAAELVTVDVDTLVERRDLGPRAATLVRAGEQIPASLVALPRRPA